MGSNWMLKFLLQINVFNYQMNCLLEWKSKRSRICGSNQAIHLSFLNVKTSFHVRTLQNTFHSLSLSYLAKTENREFM